MAYSDQQRPGGIGWKAVTGISLTVLLGGLILVGWLVTRFDLWPASQQAEVAGKAEAEETAENAVADGAAGSKDDADKKVASASDDTGVVVAKIEQLEDRLSEIGTGGSDANSASGRANAVVTALSVRRAIESGTALGITESQLRLRFGGSHAQAVAAIQAAALAPVKLSELRDDLARNGRRMLSKNGDDSLWGRINLELSELFLLRERETPSRAPSQILQRAERQISNGDVRGAIADIERLPENAVQQRWLTEAKRYLAARDALDTIERAALSSPVNVPALPPALAPEAAAASASDAPDAAPKGEVKESARETE